MSKVFRSSEGVPEGWTKIYKERKSGNTAGLFDVYIESPSGQKFRSKPDLQKYLERSGDSTYDISDFNFKRNPGEIEGATPVTDDLSSKRRKRTGENAPGSGTKKSRKSGLTGQAIKWDVADADSFAAPVQESLLEKYTGDPWKFIMAAFLVENAEKRETESVKELIAVFFEAYPDAHALQQAGWLNVHDWFKARDSAADETFAQLLSRYTFDYLFKENEKSTPHRLWGVSGFVVSCYRIFVQEDLRASTSYGGDLLNYKRRVNERLRA